MVSTPRTRISALIRSENHLIDIFMVNILLFLIWRDKHITWLVFTCACSACLRVRFWFMVSENTRVKLWQFVPVSRIKALKLKQASFRFLHSQTLLTRVILRMQRRLGLARWQSARARPSVRELPSSFPRCDDDKSSFRLLCKMSAPLASVLPV